MEKVRGNSDTSVPRIRFLREKDAEAVRARKHEGTSVMALLTAPRGDVLLNLRDDQPGVVHPGHWAIIGGGVEPGEGLDEALRREVAEEIGYELDVAREFCRIVDWEGNRHLVIVYVATIDATIDELHLGEGKEIRFFPPGTIARLKLSPFVKEVVSAFFEESGFEPAS
jgi:8-oxo-dGTP pyrophosphatase MutT (NUDIX family)